MKQGQQLSGDLVVSVAEGQSSYNDFANLSTLEDIKTVITTVTVTADPDTFANISDDVITITIENGDDGNANVDDYRISNVVVSSDTASGIISYDTPEPSENSVKVVQVNSSTLGDIFAADATKESKDIYVILADDSSNKYYALAKVLMLTSVDRKPAIEIEEADADDEDIDDKGEMITAVSTGSEQGYNVVINSSSSVVNATYKVEELPNWLTYSEADGALTITYNGDYDGTLTEGDYTVSVLAANDTNGKRYSWTITVSYPKFTAEIYEDDSTTNLGITTITRTVASGDELEFTISASGGSTLKDIEFTCASEDEDWIVCEPDDPAAELRKLSISFEPTSKEISATPYVVEVVVAKEGEDSITYTFNITVTSGSITIDTPATVNATTGTERTITLTAKYNTWASKSDDRIVWPATVRLSNSTSSFDMVTTTTSPELSDHTSTVTYTFTADTAGTYTGSVSVTSADPVTVRVVVVEAAKPEKKTVTFANGSSADIETADSNLISIKQAEDGTIQIEATTNGGVASVNYELPTDTTSTAGKFYNAVVGKISWVLTVDKTTFPTWIYFSNGTGTRSGNTLTIELDKGINPIIVVDNASRLSSVSSNLAGIAATTDYNLTLSASGTDEDGETQTLENAMNMEIAADEKTSDDPVSGPGSSSGGCNAGFGILGLALAGTLFARKRG